MLHIMGIYWYVHLKKSNMCKCLIFAHATEQYLADILLTIDQLFPSVTCNVVTRQHVP